jgi:hypothetical protein
VAKILGATHDDAIGIGDGARIQAIAGRAKYLASAGRGRDLPVTASEPIAPTVAADHHPAPTPVSTVTPNPTSQTLASEAPVGNKPESAPAVVTDAPAPAKGPAEPTFWDDVKGESQKHALADHLTFNIGPSLWSVEGTGIPTGKAKFPIWLFNSLGVGAERTFFYKIRGSAVANILLGSTTQSTYFGYDASARLYWEDDLNVSDGFLKGWRGGVIGQLMGLSVSSGSFGGGDWWRGGIFGGAFGSVRIGDQGDRYDWYTHLGFMPMNIGRIGYNGSMRSVESASGIFWEFGAFQYEPAAVLQWGGGFEYIDEKQTLANGRRPHYSAINLKLLGKYRL